MPHQDLPAWLLERRQAIGQRIRERRLWANLTQERLAEHIGIDRRTVQRIEAGTSDPTLTSLLLISRALDAPLTMLLAD